MYSHITLHYVKKTLIGFVANDIERTGKHSISQQSSMARVQYFNCYTKGLGRSLRHRPDGGRGGAVGHLRHQSERGEHYGMYA